MSENIYDMKLHDELVLPELGQRSKITRVPGGWIYSIKDEYSAAIRPVFVPFHEEFKGS
ncbi:hypothetical protein ACFL4M_02690 [Pseudomonadota bacterium]